MILIIHFLFGAAIFLLFKNLPAALLVSFLSHYLLDSLPHHDYSVKKIKEKDWQNSFFDFLKVFADFSLAIVIVLLFSKKPLPSLLCGFLSVLPDGLSFLNIIFPNAFLKKEEDFHSKIHFNINKKISDFWKFLCQGFLILIIIFIFWSK